MNNHNELKQENEKTSSEQKAEWTAPTLTVIPMSNTNSGITFVVPNMENSFYSPSPS